MHDYDGMFFGGGFMWIFWIILIAVLVLAIKQVMNTQSNGKTSKQDSPLGILKKRYAQGEIDEDTYRHQREELEKQD